ncbi:hypothetical protein ACIQSO_22800 [Pseudomonas putida]|uniref:hypothetical protein n=1 Tax=Pseudomonas putida TaxID=303 RepID=UPI00383A3390
MKKISLSFAAFALFASLGLSAPAMADGGMTTSPVGGDNNIGKCQTCVRIGGALKCFPIC